MEINPKKPLGKLIHSQQIYTWDEALEYIWKLPYGRNSHRYKIDEVITEQKGSCSTKHAFLKELAGESSLPQVQLMLGIFMMDSNLAPIEKILQSYKLKAIPEAHCYLKIYDSYIDITFPEKTNKYLELHIIQEMEIEPHKIDNYKVQYHKNYIKKWISEHQIPYNFTEIWAIREQCISHLSLLN